MTRSKASSIYVHVPFCRKLCPYCSFPRTVYRPDWAFSYVGVLLEEIRKKDPCGLSTAYVGGGTPSSLPAELLSKLLAELRGRLVGDYEFTVECNPEDVDESLAKLLADSGVNRVSMGLQSSRDDALAVLGRPHGQEMAVRAMENLRKAGIANVSLDIIYGLPGETLDEVDADISFLLNLKPEHFSAYSLEIHDGSAFFRRGFREADDSILSEHLTLIKQRAIEHGFSRYEVSSFAKPGFESRHNKVYWKDEEYIGVGMGAAGYENGIRYVNPSLYIPYINGTAPSLEKVESRAKAEYFLLTNLRLREGFQVSKYAETVGEAIPNTMLSKIAELEKEGLLSTEAGRIAPTDRGLDLLDRILIALFDTIQEG